MPRREIRERSENANLLVCAILEQYRREGVPVPYTMDDFKRDFLKEHLKDLTPQERLEGLSAEERLEGLSAEEIERILEKRKAERPSRPRKPRRKR
jgi:hypothetical protein